MIHFSFSPRMRFKVYKYFYAVLPMKPNYISKVILANGFQLGVDTPPGVIDSFQGGEQNIYFASVTSKYL